MSTGFTKWSNNPVNNLNIKAVKFGSQKPILETALNELQDLVLTSKMRSNRAFLPQNCYTSSEGSKLCWAYGWVGGVRYAHLMLLATSTTDVIVFNFGSGVEFSINPNVVGEQQLASVEFPSEPILGQAVTLIMKANYTHVSPDPVDSNYDEKVAFAIDSRYPSLIDTQRVAVQSGFEALNLDLLNESYSSVRDRVILQSVNTLSDTETVSEIILGSWLYTNWNLNPKWYMVYGIIDGANPKSPTAFTIATQFSPNKERADLILTGVNDGAAINEALMALTALRAYTTIAVRVDFLGGNITLEEAIVIPTNFKIYGNGVILTTTNTSFKALIISEGNTVFVDGLNIYGADYGIYNYGTATINSCNCDGNTYDGIRNNGTATITNCNFDSNTYRGIYNTGIATITNCNCNNNGIDGIGNGLLGTGVATITNCNCGNNDNAGIYNTNTKSIIIGNTCLNNTVGNIIDTGIGAIIEHNIIA